MALIDYLVRQIEPIMIHLTRDYAQLAQCFDGSRLAYIVGHEGVRGGRNGGDAARGVQRRK
jgi:hypothetical protein